MKRLLPLLLLFMPVLPLAASDAEAPAPTAPPSAATPTPSAAPAPSATPSPSSGAHTRLFQIILLRGTTSGSEELTGLPKNAEKAVKDVRDFLPFKSYKLLDSALLRIDESGKTQLEGIPPQQYEVSFAFRPMAGNKLSIWSFRLVAVKPKGGTPLPRGVAPEAERALIDTSFTVDLGETIVVGSSKLGGSEALVVLFTALPK
jgi:hypothetical protein